MKRILITGSNSYIGTTFEKWLAQYPDRYSVSTLNMKDSSWKMNEFSGYDVVFHVAGIAHVSRDPKLENLYYQVNRDLTIDTATKAKTEGVKQFIFMSSIIVYGDSDISLRVIDRYTIPTPSNFYGKSKLQAEDGIQSLESEEFRVVILRPPMIFGKGSKGNYQKLVKLAKISPVFPDIDNQRSILYIDNLCEFVRLMIDNHESGIFFPQNREYVKTSEMVQKIAEVHRKNIRLTKVFNPVIRIMEMNIGLIKKVFGNLVYQKEISIYKDNYQIYDFNESIKASESVK